MPPAPTSAEPTATAGTSKASRKRPLAQNERSLLRILLEVGPRGVTRGELARGSGLTPQAVGYILDSEAWSKIVDSTAAAPASQKRPGRPAERFALKRDLAWILGIDFGHHVVKVGLADLWAGWVVEPEKIAIDAETRPLEALRNAVRIATDQATNDGGGFDDVAAVSIAIAAPVNDETGTVRSNSGTDKWENIRFPERIREYLRRETPVLIANDANVGALAERYEAAKRSPETVRDYADAVYLRWTSGIGAGLLIGGKMYAGSGGAAGEVGHAVVTREEGDDWRWESDVQLKREEVYCTRGCDHPCVEALARADSILDDVRVRFRANGVIDDVPASIEEVLASAASGQLECVESLRLAARYAGQMLSTVADVLNPSSVIIGGDFKDQLALVEDDLRDVIDKSAFGPVRKDLSLISGRVEGAVINGTIVHALESEAVVTHLFNRLAAEWAAEWETD